MQVFEVTLNESQQVMEVTVTDGAAPVQFEILSDAALVQHFSRRAEAARDVAVSAEVSAGEFMATVDHHLPMIQDVPVQHAEVLDAKDLVLVRASDAEAAKLSAQQDAAATAADRVVTGEDRVQTGLDTEATAADRVATDADRTATGLDAQATEADRTATGMDAAATAGDRVQTNSDATATAADATQTAADRVQTGADATATGEDALATADDRIATGQDATATAADRTATGLDAQATAADAIATAADRVATGDDAAATAADRNQTGLDRTATGADATATAADRAATDADATATAADRVATAADAEKTSKDRAAVKNIFDHFDERYLGPKTEDPTVDNSGNPLFAGQVYWNEIAEALRFYNGATWEAPATQAATSATEAYDSAVAAGQSKDEAAAHAAQTALDRIATGQDADATAADRVATGQDRVAAADSASSASGDATATAADRVQTGNDAQATSADATSTAADRVATGADADATAADRVQTGQDANATAADRNQTGLDRTATGNDATATAADRVATGEDRSATGNDASATAADRVATGDDRTATNADAAATAADRVQTGDDRTQTGADRTQTGLDRTAAADSKTAAEAAQSGAELAETNAAGHETAAAGSASSASADASFADSRATASDASAAASAASETAAEGHKNAADTSATNAAASEVGADENRGYAQEWAITAEDVEVSGAAGGGVGAYSSLHYAAKAEQFAADAEASAAQAAGTTLAGLDDTTFTTTANNNVLQLVDGVWINRTLAQADIATATGLSSLSTTVDGKVDKVTGKELTTVDFTVARRDKLAGIEAGAQANVGDTFNAAGDYTGLRARGTTLADVGAYAATNPSNFVDGAGAVTAIKGDTAWNATNWDAAAGWGDHAQAGYITGYTVTQGDVTAHQAALSITESQISDLSHYSPSTLLSDYGFTDNSANWDAAYQWGDHSTAGYEPGFTKNTAFNKNFGAAVDTVTQGNDSRLSNSREWIADTVTLAEAQTGTATTRRAWTAARVRDSVLAHQTDTNTTYDAGTGMTLTGTTFSVDSPFDASGDYTGLRARATTLEDVGAYSATNPSNFVDGAGAATAIKADAAWNATNWDLAFGWGDHALAGYLTSVTWTDVSGKPTEFTPEAHGHTAGEVSGLATVATSGSYADLANKPVIPNGYMADLNRATDAQIRGFTGNVGLTADRLATASALIAPAGTSNWTPDWSAFVSAEWVITANRTLGNPTNVIPGTVRMVTIQSSSTTERTVTFGSNYKNVPDVAVTTANRVTLSLYAVSATEIIVTAAEWTA